MRHLFIMNPAAGRKGSTEALVQKIEALNLDAAVVYTKKQGDARSIAQKAAAEGNPLRIYACGGDGTLNEVVNGAAGYDNVAVTNVPKGTGNDFIKIFGEQYRALFSDLQQLACGEEALFDLIECNGVLGINTLCTGVDARVAADVHRYKNLPLVSGRMAYIFSLIANVIKGLSRPLRVQCQTFDWTGDSTIFCLCNGRYYGGGFMPSDDARPDDGILTTLLVPKIGLLTFLRLVGRYAKGEYRQLRPLVQDYYENEYTLTADEPFPVAIDGEIMWDRQFVIRLSERKIKFFYPSGATYLGTRKT